MWLLTSGADPRGRVFINAERLSGISSLTGEAFQNAIHPQVLQGIAADDTVLVGRDPYSERPQFLMSFKDDDECNKLGTVQKAIREAFGKGSDVLDLEELGRLISR